LIKLAPPEQGRYFGEVLDKLHSVLVRWIIGRMLSMTLVGVATAIGLLLLEVPLPITLAVIRGTAHVHPQHRAIARRSAPDARGAAGEHKHRALRDPVQHHPADGRELPGHTARRAPAK
jgi:hypothetical protein